MEIWKGEVRLVGSELIPRVFEPQAEGKGEQNIQRDAVKLHGNEIKERRCS